MAWDKPGPLQLLLCANVLLLAALRSDHSAASWLPAPADGCGPHGVLVQLVSCPLVLLTLLQAGEALLAVYPPAPLGSDSRVAPRRPWRWGGHPGQQRAAAELSTRRSAQCDGTTPPLLS
eukprot:EG_transcript_28323